MRCMEQDKNLRLSLPRKVIIFILGFLDNMLFGGAIFGWPQLVYVLKKEGVFGHLCNAGNEVLDTFQLENTTLLYPSESKIMMGIDFSNVTRCQGNIDYNSTVSNLTTYKQTTTVIEWEQCDEQDERFALAYTVATALYGIPGIAIGFILHHAGLRITRVMGGLMIATSFLFFSFVSAESPNWLFPAASLLSVGGNQLRMSNMQFGDLFPSYRSTTITVLSGVYAASASLFLLFAYAQEHGVSLQLVCYCIGGFTICSTILSILMPVHHIPYEKPPEEKVEAAKLSSNLEKEPSLWQSMNTLSSWLHCYWFILMIFCINFYQQIYNVWVTASTCTDEEAGLYSSFFSYSNLLGVFCAPVGGVFTDFLVRRAKKNSDNQLKFMTKEIQANFLPLFLTTVFALAMYGCLFFFNPVAVIVSLVFMVIVRPCIFAISTAYIRIRFPANHFSRLIGIYCSIVGIATYFQYPIFQLAQKRYYLAQGIVIVLIAFSLLNPLHLLSSRLVRRHVMEREGLHENTPLLIVK